jgi:hypothetical protein
MGLTNNLLIEPALATDHKLRRDIWSALKTVPALERNPTLNVTVQNGEAILEGEVQGIAAQKAAEKAAQSVEGVRKVVNQLKIVPRGRALKSTQRLEIPSTMGSDRWSHRFSLMLLSVIRRVRHNGFWDLVRGHRLCLRDPHSMGCGATNRLRQGKGARASTWVLAVQIEKRKPTFRLW